MSGIGKCYTIYREIASKKLPKENSNWVWRKKYWDIEKNVEDKTFGSFPRHSLYKDYLNVTVTV